MGRHQLLVCRYDENKKGFLDMTDLRSVLLDLGMMEGVRNRDHYVAAQLQMADKSQSGTLSVEEFSSYYSSLVLAGVHLPLVLLDLGTSMWGFPAEDRTQLDLKFWSTISWDV